MGSLPPFPPPPPQIQGQTIAGYITRKPQLKFDTLQLKCHWIILKAFQSQSNFFALLIIYFSPYF